MNDFNSVLKSGLLFWVGSLLLSFLVAPLIINLLYKFHLTVRHSINKDKKNKQFVSIHGWKSGTPNMGGIIVLIVVLFWFLVLGQLDCLWQISKDPILIIGFIILGLIGFFDNLLVDLSKNNDKLRRFQDLLIFRLSKFLLMFGVGAVLAFIISDQVDAFSVIEVIGIVRDIGLFAVAIFAFLMTLFVYAFDIYDGADGLFSGTLLINIMGMILLLLVQGNYYYIPVLFILLGTLCTFLYFNIPPARVWLGAVGAMPIGFSIFYIGFITNNLIPVIIMSLMQWIVFASSFIQIISIKLWDKKVFKIAPIHHHFEAKGWPEYKVVMRFWLFAVIFTLSGVLFGLYF